MNEQHMVMRPIELVNLRLIIGKLNSVADAGELQSLEAESAGFKELPASQLRTNAKLSGWR